jgi:hypothetical protein
MALVLTTSASSQARRVRVYQSAKLKFQHNYFLLQSFLGLQDDIRSGAPFSLIE